MTLPFVSNYSRDIVTFCTEMVKFICKTFLQTIFPNVRKKLLAMSAKAV